METKFHQCKSCGTKLTITRTVQHPTFTERFKVCAACGKDAAHTAELRWGRYEMLVAHETTMASLEELREAALSSPAPFEQVPLTPTPTVLPEEVTSQEVEKPLYDEYNNPLNEAARAEQDKYDQQLADEMADYEEEQARQVNP